MKSCPLQLYLVGSASENYSLQRTSSMKWMTILWSTIQWTRGIRKPIWWHWMQRRESNKSCCYFGAKITMIYQKKNQLQQLTLGVSHCGGCTHQEDFIYFFLTWIVISTKCLYFEWISLTEYEKQNNKHQTHGIAHHAESTIANVQINPTTTYCVHLLRNH